MGERRFRRGDRETVITEAGAPAGADAPTYVLVHGIGMGHRTWSDLAAALARSGRVLALDLPGFGEAPEPETSLTMAESGAYLAELVEAESPGRPVVLVGHSMGTQIVAETAAQRPDLVASVVLIAPTVNVRERSAIVQALRMAQDVSLAQPKVLALGVRYYVQAGPRWYFRKLGDMLAHRIEAVLPCIHAPTLVIRGEHDAVSPRDWCELVVSLLPDARLAEVPGRGHETMITAGGRVAELIAAHARGERADPEERHPEFRRSHAIQDDSGDLLLSSVRSPETSTSADASAADAADASATSAADATADTSGRAPRVTWARAARWWAADYAYALRRQLAVLGAGRSPARWLRGDDTLPDIVLLPGVYEHWTFVRPLAERLNRAGHRVHVVHGLGVNRRPVDETAAKLARALARTRTPAAGRVIVAHSKGGLIGKRVLVDGPEGLGLLGVVAICTPFGGSTRARLFVDRSIRAFLPDNPTIAALRAVADVNARIVSVFGVFDPHIPGGSALDGAAANVEVPVAGHFRPLGSPATADAVLDGIALLVASARQ